MTTTHQVSILLVEDNEQDVALTLRAIEKNAIRPHVVVARDGYEALKLLLEPENNDSPFAHRLPQLVLLDLKLPKIDGLQVLHRIRTSDRTRNVPVVILTTSLEESDLRSAYESGANSYIRKPINFTQFSDAIKNIIHYWLVLNERLSSCH